VKQINTPDFSPERPISLHLQVKGIRPRLVIVATGYDSTHERVNAVIPTRAILRVAAQQEIRLLGMPLLASGGAPSARAIDLVVTQTLTCLAEELHQTPIREVVLFTLNPLVERTLIEKSKSGFATARLKAAQFKGQTARGLAEAYLRGRKAKLTPEVAGLLDWISHLAPSRSHNPHQFSSRLLILGTLDYLLRVAEPKEIETHFKGLGNFGAALIEYFDQDVAWPPGNPALPVVTRLTANARLMFAEMSKAGGSVTVEDFFRGLLAAPLTSSGGRVLRELGLNANSLGALREIVERHGVDVHIGAEDRKGAAKRPDDEAAAAEESDQGHDEQSNQEEGLRSTDGLILDENGVLDGGPIQEKAQGEKENEAKPSRRDYVGRFQIDSPATSGEDAIGIQHEVLAFARLVASRNVSPPLSVGVFGDWGAGKSYFMSQVRSAVDGLGVSSASFHDRIVHIHFNAWHYIETNLWASLVEYIFTELDRWLRTESKVSEEDIERLFAQLSTTKELKLVAAEDLVRARLDHKTADEELARARSTLAEAQRIRFEDLVATALSDDQRTKLNDASAALGLPTAGRSTAELVQSWDAAKLETTRGTLVLNSLLVQAGSGWSIFLAILALIAAPLGAALLLSLLEAQQLDSLFNRVHDGVIALSAFVASISAILGRWIAKGRKAVDTVQSIQSAVQKNAEKRAAGSAPDVAMAETQVEKARQEMLEAERRLVLASAAVAESARSYDADTAKGRLNRFIRERVTKGGYSKHLGMVATIRKDFGQLSQMMAEDKKDSWSEDMATLNQGYTEKAEALITSHATLLSDREKADLRGTQASEQRYFERIILYIDDLDRCPPDKVADVLQAIHMLLYFPLFVVFVAVDAKWLAFSLHDHFPAMRIASLGKKGDDENGSPGPASVEDYLEKIFQVPYWVPRMDGAAVANFVGNLTDDAIGPAPGTLPVKAEDRNGGAGRDVRVEDEHAGAGSSGSPEHAAGDVEQPPADTHEPKDKEEVQDANRLAQSERQSGETGAASVEPIYVDLTLTKDEQADLRALALHVGKTPRRIKAYVNRYFLVQTTLRLHDPERAELRVTTRAVATLLAIATASPRGAAEFFEQLDTLPKRTSLAALTQLSKNTPDAEGICQKVLEGLTSLQKSDPAGNERELVEALRRNAPIVRRYSFRTGTSVGIKQHDQPDSMAQP